jgi:hypothetical protein
MTQIVYLIEQIAPGAYVICAVGVLWFLRKYLVARSRLALAEFELERELEEQSRATAITWTLLFAEAGLAVFAIAAVIAPTLRADLLAAGNPNAALPGAGAIPTRFATSTPGGDGLGAEAVFLTVTAQAAAGDGGGILLLTAVASPTPVGTIVPGYPTPADCAGPQASLEIPANGQVIFDSLTVVGTANIPNFAFYKLELRGPSTGGEFSPILGEKTSPVIEKGVLGQLPLSPFAPGDYTFRLAVFDNTGMLRASCTVWVNIRERPPTPTPPGGGS